MRVRIVFDENVREDEPVYVISKAAELAGMHPQTLRQYDRLGLVTPRRTSGRGRRYSRRDVAQLVEIQRLSHEEGINLAGIKRILDLENQVRELESRVELLTAQVNPGSRIFMAGAEGDVVPQRRKPLFSRRMRGRAGSGAGFGNAGRLYPREPLQLTARVEEITHRTVMQDGTRLAKDGAGLVHDAQLAAHSSRVERRQARSTSVQGGRIIEVTSVAEVAVGPSETQSSGAESALASALQASQDAARFPGGRPVGTDGSAGRLASGRALIVWTPDD